MPVLDLEPRALDRDSVEAYVRKICDSPEFHKSDRLKRFLRYVVAEKLDGNESRLKAYSVALAVFDRPSSFDPQLDPVVRIEAGRLRRALDRYYLAHGSDDELVIDIPKGGYVPQFVPRACCETSGSDADDAAAPAPVSASFADDANSSAEEVKANAASRPLPAILRSRWAAAACGFAAALGVVAVAALIGGTASKSVRPAEGTRGPVVAVMPFTSTPGEARAAQIAQGLSDELIDQLATFSELRILGRETARKIPGDEAAVQWARYGVRYVIEGTVYATANGGTVSARLVDASNGQVVWIERYPIAETSDLLALQIDLGGKLANTIGRPYGVVFRTEAMRSQVRASRDWSEYDCTLRYYAYRAELSREKHKASTECLRQVLKRSPEKASAWAMLAMLGMDEFRAGFPEGRDRQAALARFLEAATTAYSLAPDNIRAVQSLMLARFFSGDVAGGTEFGYRALRINPNDTEVLGEFGTRLAQSGQVEDGRRMVARALALNPGNANYYLAQLAFIDYLGEDYRSAEALLLQSNLQDWPLQPLVLSLVREGQGKRSEAKQDFARFMAVHSDFVANIEAEMQSRNLQQPVRERIRSAVRVLQNHPS